jgi:hypothetical protein
MEAITEPGTIDDLVADARAAGYSATSRLVRDWTEAGLLDYPQKRPAGRGRGSRPAIYTAEQRMLFLTLLHHRQAGNHIQSLARIPVGIWMYWGDQHVPLRLARRAFLTWIGDPRVSLQRAKETARQILGQLDNPRASSKARQRLTRVLTDVNYTGTADFAELEDSIRDVFEPDTNLIRRAVGHPAAPVMTESFIAVAKARLMAVQRLLADEVSDEAFVQAREAHIYAYAEYAARQPMLALSSPAMRPVLYEPVAAENALNDCCRHLLTAIGMEIMFPEQAESLGARREGAPRPTAAALGLA